MSNWECLNCGETNDHDSERCTKCDLEKEVSVAMRVVKRKRMCEECGHRHREGVYCHAYCEEADGGGALDDYISASESEEASSSDDSDDIDLGVVKSIMASGGKKIPKMRPLDTPKFVKAMGYIRCNCKHGVPPESKRFEAIPAIVMVEGIRVQTYSEIMIPSDKYQFSVYMQSKYTAAGEYQREEEKKTSIALNIPLILSYLPLGSCSAVPQVCTYWNYGTSLYQEYIDMRNCVPYQVFRPHMGQVDSVLICGDKVYSGGDRRVLASDYAAGEVLSVITRDSGSIPYLFEFEQDLYMSSSNGSIRTYNLTHTGKNIKMDKTLWEHSRAVNHLITGLPSVGICEMHGIEGHICTMYTASEDRTIKLWNFVKLKAIRSISAKALRTTTFTRLAQSDRHLFAGTTSAMVAVFCKHNHCERDDVHTCYIPDKDQSYCLQLTLKLPPISMDSGAAATVTGLLCVEMSGVWSHLWAGDSTGQLTIWYVPEEGLGFMPAHTVKAHYGAINNVVRTYKHAITISDDGFVIFFDLARFDRVRSIDIGFWSNYRQLIARPDIERRIKCTHLQENYETGGTLVLGTSYGEIVVLSLGTTC